MRLFEWDSSLEINIEQIDDQHRQLFQIVNDYFLAMKEAKAYRNLSNTVSTLIDYAQRHFSVEEELFVKHSYVHTEEHLRQHADFLEKIESYRAMLDGDLARVEGKSITVEVWEFMKGWLINHIKVEDMKYRNDFIRTGAMAEITGN